MMQHPSPHKAPQALTTPEDRLGLRLGRILVTDSAQLPPQTQQRLDAARLQALAAQTASPKHAAMGLGHSAALGGGKFTHEHYKWLLLMLTALCLLLAGWAYQHWSGQHLNLELGAQSDMDILLDELPPQAYADADFAQYLQQTAPITPAPDTDSNQP